MINLLAFAFFPKKRDKEIKFEREIHRKNEGGRVRERERGVVLGRGGGGGGGEAEQT